CDSIVTLDLTIIDSDFNLSVSVDGNTLTAEEENATFQWIDCDNNNSPIEGETAQSFIATIPGNYAVVLTSLTCTEFSVTSDCHFAGSTGLNSFNHIALNIYPNPTLNVLNFDSSSEI